MQRAGEESVFKKRNSPSVRLGRFPMQRRCLFPERESEKKASAAASSSSSNGGVGTLFRGAGFLLDARGCPLTQLLGISNDIQSRSAGSAEQPAIDRSGPAGTRLHDVPLNQTSRPVSLDASEAALYRDRRCRTHARAQFVSPTFSPITAAVPRWTRLARRLALAQVHSL